MCDQLYGGYARRRIQYKDISADIAIYMGNEALTGFWIEIYGVIR